MLRKRKKGGECAGGEFVMLLEECLNKVMEASPEIRAVSDYIYRHPEIALQEYKAVEKQCALLKKWDFSIRRRVGGLDTAFCASRTTGKAPADSKTGKKRPKFCFLSEYDALPGLGHGCGHHLICASALAAARAASELMEEKGMDAEVLLMGTPAEEGKGGKVILVREGGFQGIDACLISHPYDVSSMDDGALSVTHCRVIFHGVASHAAMAPEKGVNALNAMIQFFNGLALWRQCLPENTRVHGIITNGGAAANVIPDCTEALIYVRAPDNETQEKMERHFREIAEGAAFSTGTTVELINESGYRAIRWNRSFNEEYAACWEKMGETIRHAKGCEGRASTDFGDVSQIMPGANLHFGICAEAGVPLHCVEFREAAGTDFAFSQAMKTGAAMAAICIRYCSDPGFRASVDGDFRQ